MTTILEHYPRAPEHSYQRDYWMQNPIITEELSHMTFEEFEHIYQPAAMIPSPELYNHLIFAGQQDLNGLRRLTRDRIDQLSKSYDETDFTTSPNIVKSFQIVERLMETMKPRRTGEDAVAHIYRDVLRVIEFIHGYNSIYQERCGDKLFTPEVAEFYLSQAILHDFLEDEVEEGYGTTKLIGYCPESTGIEFGTVNTGAQFSVRRVMNGNGTAGEDIQSIRLDFSPYDEADNTNNFLFVGGLKALNSGNLRGKEAMRQLEQGVDTMLREQQVDMTVRDNWLMAMAPYIIKCCDRLDNNATMTFEMNEGSQLSPRPSRKVYEKVVENYVLFSHVLSVLKSIAEDDAKSIEQIAKEKPFYLKYDPTRWCKAIQSGIPIDELYRPPTSHDESLSFIIIL